MEAVSDDMTKLMTVRVSRGCPWVAYCNFYHLSALSLELDNGGERLREIYFNFDVGEG